MQNKTFVGKILAAIAGLFSGILKHVFEGAEKTFDELPDDIKNALIHGSGVMDLIGSMLDNTPAEIRAAIKEKFPDIDEAALESGLFQIAHGYNLLPEENNLDDVIAKIQEKLKSLNTPVWDDIIQGMAKLIAIILAPEGTKFAVIASTIEYVYQKYFKK